MLTKRTCGVLLHPTSLPGPGGIGSMGADARRFIDVISSMGMSYWQLLPLTPPACGNSPYSAFSAFAGNPLLIDLEQIADEGDLSAADCCSLNSNESRVDFNAVSELKLKLLQQAGSAFLAEEETPRKREFWHFCDTTRWLHDYALFMAIKNIQKGKSWDKWPKELSMLTPSMFEKTSVELGPEIGLQKYMQWQFFRQWKALRRYATAQGIKIIGDIPIFVAFDSADVWSRRNLFQLDSRGKPVEVAGVPPDYFSKTGQLWGNPLYDWDLMKHEGYSWWVDRFRSIFEIYDIVRIDHFRGFEAAWHVPASHRTAEKGQWIKGPGADLFDTVFSSLGPLPIIAEDLGVITPEVEALRDRYGFPGMKILQFAFDSGPSNPYLPHNHIKECVVYTGTHDNDTTAGWLGSLSDPQRSRVQQYLGAKGVELQEAMTHVALMSVADTVIFPFQDLLKLGNESRMNVPGTAFGNWEWRFSWDALPPDLTAEVRSRLDCFGRINTTSNFLTNRAY
ncbi:MAG: 4-alpha-glucanotransferase [Desulfuromonadaceae bacterium]|nr:4-alpha-glucanotransferase [Desulfuromonadaceae bacterium]